MPAVKAAIDAYNPNEAAEVALPKLCNLADVVSTQNSIWKSEVMRLSVLDVDEELMRHVIDEVEIGDQANVSLSGMAESAVAIYQWQKKKSTLPENIFTDMVETA